VKRTLLFLFEFVVIRDWSDRLRLCGEVRQMKCAMTIERMPEERATLTKQTIALNLLKQGIEMETIAQAAGLTIVQLGKLRAGN
jgi:uncharacterized protein YwlG (UPF0340 family)